MGRCNLLWGVGGREQILFGEGRITLLNHDWMWDMWIWDWW